MSDLTDLESAAHDQAGSAMALQQKSNDLPVAAVLAVIGALAAFVAIRAVTPEVFPSITTRVMSASVRGPIERIRFIQTANQVSEALRFGVGCGLLWIMMRSGLKGRSGLFKAALLCVFAMLLPGPPLTLVLQLSRSNEWLVFALSLLGSAIFFVAIVGLAAVAALKARGATPGS